MSIKKSFIAISKVKKPDDSETETYRNLQIFSCSFLTLTPPITSSCS